MRRLVIGVLAGLLTFALPCWLAMEALGGLFGSVPNHRAYLILALGMLPGAAIATNVVKPWLQPDGLPWKAGLVGGSVMVATAVLTAAIVGMQFTPQALLLAPVMATFYSLLGPTPLLGTVWAAALLRFG